MASARSAHGLGSGAEIWEANNAVKGDAALHASQCCPQAEVRSVSEREVRVGTAGDVEAIRLLAGGGVAVRGAV